MAVTTGGALVAPVGAAYAATPSTAYQLALVAGRMHVAPNAPATDSQISPTSIATDASGNIYFIDATNRVEKVTPSGIISTVAGSGVENAAAPNQLAQPGPAVASAMLPRGVAVDASGNVYVADGLGYVEKVDTSGTLSIIAGTGPPHGSESPTAGPAVNSTIQPSAIAVDGNGNLFVTDMNGYLVEISAAGVLSYVAGNGFIAGYPTPGPALQSTIETNAIALGPNGDIYLGGGYWGSRSGSYVEKISNGVLSLPAGPDPAMHGGMGPATDVSFADIVNDVAVAADGTIYVASGSRVYRIANGAVTTFAGYPGYPYAQKSFPPKPGPATSSPMTAVAVALDTSGNLLIGDSGVSTSWWTSPSGFLESVTPSGSLSVLGGDLRTVSPGPAILSPMTPSAVAADSQGNLYVSTEAGVVKVDPSGALTMFAGNGQAGPPVNGPALSSPASAGGALALDGADNLYFITDGYVVRVTPAGTLTIVAGNGQAGTPVPGPAASSPISATALAVDPSGDIYLESGDLYKIAPDGNLSHFAGGGSTWPSSWPASADAIQIYPGPIGADSNGNVYAMAGSDGVYKITPSGSVTLLAGGTYNTSVTPGPAYNSAIAATSMARDSLGDMYFIDHTYVMKVTPDGTLFVVGGDGSNDGSATGGWHEGAFPGWARQVGLSPVALASDPQGKLYVADAGGFVLSMTPTPATAPSAPTNISAVAGSSAATVTFAPSLDTGGTPVTRYVVSDGAGHTCSPTLNLQLGSLDLYTRHTLSCTVTGLTPGSPVTFTVTATNAVGTSPSSTASNSVTPFTVPSAPTGLTATAANGQVQLSWTAPADDGGSPITGYDLTSQDVTGNQGVAPTCTSAQQSTATSCTVVNLYNAHSYTFTVAARNDAGPGATTSISATPVGPPDGPQNVTAVAGNGSAVVGWTVPADQGSTITHYTVTASPGGATATVNGTALQGQRMSTTVGGLTNGASYRFTVTATNSAGTSVPSTPSGWVTPAAPKTPTRVAISGAHPYTTGARRYYPIRVYVKTSGTPSGYVYLKVTGTPGVTKTYKVPANSTTGVVVSIALTGKSGILNISASYGGSPGFAAAPPYSFNPRIIA